MSQAMIRAGLVVAVVLQLCILSGMVVKAAMPLWNGTEIRVKTVPVDPRSLFRGNYARLNYDFTSLPEGVFGGSNEIGAGSENIFGPNHELRIGEVVYTSLQPGTDGLYEYAGASLEPPQEGIFLRGRITGFYPEIRVNYGIDAFFAPKEKALQLEKDLRDGGVAVLMVTSDGHVALKDVIGQPK
jgi:uncharacterized membrane-anchored protein